MYTTESLDISEHNWPRVNSVSCNSGFKNIDVFIHMHKSMKIIFLKYLESLNFLIFFFSLNKNIILSLQSNTEF